MRYQERIADGTLVERLETFGAVLIEGPKWCGKTTTAEQVARSVIKMQDPDKRHEYLATAASKPSLLLLGNNPRLIDEWQDAPVVWDAVRTMVDSRQQTGLFILTGSNAVKREAILHSGNGRISRMSMLPMSLWESKESNGRISLQQLFDEPALDIDGITSDMQVEDMIYAACRGGWPAALNLQSSKGKLSVAQNYVETVCREDISRIDGIRRDERMTRMILRAYARNISTLAKNSTLMADVVSSGEVSCTPPTFEGYVTALKRLFVVCNIDAWCPSVRSKTTLRSGVKRAFADPSIAVAALGLTPDALLTQLKTFGFIFEQMCIRDLKAYTPDFNTHISYYRDRYGLEADLVLHLNDGRYALIECKLGSDEIEEGARHLLQLKHLIREYNRKERQIPLREPDLLLVITAGQMAYTRDDGVKIVPLGCLKN